MLALTRKLGESIKIGQDITVTVTAIDRNRVRLGITAPRDVLILRTEVQERINGLDERGIPAE
jgi:carbon storage regulator